MSDDPSTTRRDAIRSTVGVAALGLAGCTGLLGGGGEGLEPGDSVESELESDAERDPIYDDLADPYTLSIDSEQRIRITMQSSSFDTYLLVTQNGDTVAEDDDGGSGFNSDLVTTLDSGTYTIWAGSFSGEETGPYSLEIGSPASGSTDEGEPESTAGGSVDPQTIQLGATVEGQIGANAPRDPINDGLATPYEFTIESQTDVRISQESESLDTLLVLTRDGQRVATNDDGGGGLNSEIVATLDPGTYTIWAGTFTGDATGSFTLELAEAEAVGDTSDARPIELGTQTTGTLTGEEPLDPVNGEPAAPWTFTLDAETTVQISMSSTAFDTLFAVTNDGQRVLVNDDGGSGLDSEATATLEAGTYTIWASSWSGSGTGEYTLSLERA